MFDVSIYSDPISAEEIRAMRNKIKGQDSLGLTVMKYCPIPIVDMVAGLAVEAIDQSINGSPTDFLKEDFQATSRDWSKTNATQSYVEKVRAMNRLLIKSEVEALERHLKIEATARYALGEVGSAITSGIKGFVAR